MAPRLLAILVVLIVFSATEVRPQPAPKKVRMGIQSTNIGFLPFHTAFHKGFYRDQGIDLEMIFMATQAVNAAFVRGDLDYSAAVNGIIQGIVRGAPAKILACAVDRPLQSFIVRKEIRTTRDLKGKKVGGSTAGGTATLDGGRGAQAFRSRTGSRRDGRTAQGQPSRRSRIGRGGRGASRRAGKHYRGGKRLRRVAVLGRCDQFSAERFRRFCEKDPGESR